ncbi:MAG: hypothetical protein QXL89_09100 [Nitrososphaeria archaeon]
MEIMKIHIRDLTSELINGVTVQMPKAIPAYKESYFEWTQSSLTAKFNSTAISGGILISWHHVPIFNEIETHVDKEMFYFISGTAIMLFVDVENGQPNLKTTQIVRIKPDTQIIIEAGKGHFVPIAETSDPLIVVVISPKMEAPRITLPITVEGI